MRATFVGIAVRQECSIEDRGKCDDKKDAAQIDEILSQQKPANIFIVDVCCLYQ